MQCLAESAAKPDRQLRIVIQRRWPFAGHAQMIEAPELAKLLYCYKHRWSGQIVGECGKICSSSGGPRQPISGA
jgi:hypothetical protein